ncbi:MAG: hypothetical protein MR900_11450 [Prevotella sp.]|nr:hypothetical protein [Prevotella sp.]
MKILYIARTDTYRYYREGINPSHWLYGAVEMEKDGNEVVWEDESRALLNDIRLVWKHLPDLVFIPNLNLRSHLLLLLITAFGLSRTPIYAFLHHEPKVKCGWKSVLYRLLLSAPRHLFFLSTKTMEETVKAGLVAKDKCSVPGWGPDIGFYGKVPKSSGKWFVSTGKENRDFDMLIEAFRRTGAPLMIMTARSHAGNDYSDLQEKCRDIPNIRVVITENSGNVYPQMLEAMANARALVCPLRKDKLNYCVGLSTIADAIGLHKPLIITRNPYHDAAYLKGMEVVETVDDWVAAINRIMAHDESTPSPCLSMQNCCQKMKGIVSALG